MKTIVSAVDFSVNSIGAADWGEQIAWSHGARLVLAHALPTSLPVTAAPEFIALPEEALLEEQDRVRERLDGEAAKRRTSGTEVETRIETGPASETLVEIAEDEKADLLVVGTRGLTGLKRTFLGSVAARVIRDASCPVLVVPSRGSEEHRPIYKLLIPTDFSEDAKLAVDSALRLLGPISAEMKLTLLHVWRVPIVISPWSAYPPMDEIERSASARARERLEEVAEPLRAEGYEVDIIESAGEPAEVIDRVASEVGADVIAMGTHGRSGLSRVVLGSVAERTLPSAPCPVLTVHSEACDA